MGKDLMPLPDCKLRKNKWDKSFKKDFIYLFSETGEGSEKGRERNIDVQEIYWLVPSCTPQLGIWLTTQACALTGNQTGDLFWFVGTQFTDSHQAGQNKSFKHSESSSWRCGSCGGPGNNGQLMPLPKLCAGCRRSRGSCLYSMRREKNGTLKLKPLSAQAWYSPASPSASLKLARSNKNRNSCQLFI